MPRNIWLSCLLSATVSLSAATLGAAASPTPEGLVEQANLELRRGRAEIAKELLEAALAMAPPDSPIRAQAENLYAGTQLALTTRARLLIDLAAKARHAGRLGEAEAFLRQVLALGAEGAEEAATLLTEVVEARRQTVQLDQAERLLAVRDYEAARTLLGEVVTNATYGDVLERARELSRRSHPGIVRSIYDRILGWVLDLLPLAIVVGSIYGVLRCLSARRRRQRDRWRLEETADETDFGAGRLIASSFSDWYHQEPPPLTTGLLLLEASRIPRSPNLSIEAMRFDWAKELESIPLTVGPVNVGTVAKLAGTVRRWFRTEGQQIRGRVHVAKDGRLVGQLTATYFEPRTEERRIAVRYHGAWRWVARWKARKLVPRAVSMIAVEKDASPEAARAVAEEVTFKMLYFVQTRDYLDSNRANDLRKGFDLLRSYMAGEAPSQGGTAWTSLEQSARVFEKVRRAWPDSFEAHLFEGIALDLLERHDEAIAHFKYVKEATEGDADQKDDYLRAVYNEAIANLRNLYQYEGIERCIELLKPLTEKLTRDTFSDASPIEVLGNAVRADALACRTLPWRKYVPEGRKADLSALKAIVEECILDVTWITDPLEEWRRAEGSKHPAWDAGSLRQLKWSIHNALGDLYLYSTVRMDEQYALEEHPEPYQDLHDVGLLIERAPEDFNRRRKSYLDRARDAFGRCEMLLPPGVETLSNLGTLFLYRDDLETARDYFNRVIRLNPSYEYAYYRLAQCWEKAKRREEVVRVLKSYPARPGIPSMRRMYQHYYVEPKDAASTAPAPGS